MQSKIKFYDMCLIISQCESQEELQNISDIIIEFKKDWALTELHVFRNLATYMEYKLRVERK